MRVDDLGRRVAEIQWLARVEVHHRSNHPAILGDALGLIARARKRGV